MLLAQAVAYTTASSGGAATGAAAAIALLLFGVIYVGVFVWSILAIIDVNKHSDAAWAATGQNKQTWLILNVVALFTCLLITAYYWFGIRPRLKAAAV